VGNDEYPIGIHVDLQKAFDALDHRKLLKQLDTFWIRGAENRQQGVQVHLVVSGLRKVSWRTTGIPFYTIIMTFVILQNYFNVSFLLTLFFLLWKKHI